MSQQFKELQKEWEKNMSNINSKSHLFESKIVLELQKRLDQKQIELDRFAKDASVLDKNQFSANLSGIKPEAHGSFIESPLRNLGISKVDKPNPENLLSRNNTLQSLLNAEQKPYTSLPKPNKQVASLQERLRKMRQVLDCPS